MTATSATVNTPIGPFTLIVAPGPAGDDAVLASGWTDDVGKLLPVVHPSLRPASIIHRADLGPFTAAVRDYHAGDVPAIDGIPVRQRSGPFLSHAWEVLRTIPAGSPVTYAEYAAKAGRPEAIRAAANACARNAAALFVPCHRVRRTGGAPGGFRWGLDAKQWLLDHEGAANLTGRPDRRA